MKIVLLTLLLSFNVSTNAMDIPPAYQEAARTAGVPADIFYAIALQESQAPITAKKTRPWPWTLNIAGKGRYYRSQQDALRALKAYIDSGKCNVDVGLGQIHWCVHAKSFPEGPAQALHPLENLAYAASVLKSEHKVVLRKKLRQKLGLDSWWIAVGRYHAPNNLKLAQTYRQRVYKKWLKLKGRRHV